MFISTLGNNIINRDVVFSDKILYNDELKDCKIETIENVSRESLESCIYAICEGSLFGAKFHTIQYSPIEKKVYFYYKGTITKARWNNPELKTKVFSKTLEDIRNVFTMEKDKCIDNVSLDTVEKLLNIRRQQIRLKNEMITNKIQKEIRNRVGISNDFSIIIYFCANSNELNIIIHNCLDYEYKGDKELKMVLVKENDKLNIKKCTINIGPFLVNEMYDELTDAYNQLKKISCLESKYKVDIKTVNSNFYVDSFFYKTKLYLCPPGYIPRALFCMEYSDDEYEYDSRSSDVIDSIAGNEKELLKRIFVKIKDLPEWMHTPLYEIRKNQLIEQQRIEDSNKKKQKRLEFVKRLNPFRKQ